MDSIKPDIQLIQLHKTLQEYENQRMPLDQYQIFILQNIQTPYTLRAKHLKMQIKRVLDLSRGELPDDYLRAMLGERIVDDISGTWIAMQGLVGALGEPVQGMDRINRIIVQIVDALNEFYAKKNSEPLRAMAHHYEESLDLPKLPPLPKKSGRKKGQISEYTEVFGQWLDELEKEGFGDAEAVAEIMKIIARKAKPSPLEKKFQRKMGKKDSRQQGKAGFYLKNSWREASQKSFLGTK